MRLNYKRLGNYIQPVEIRNRDLKTVNLIGLSVVKQFVKSKSNIIGTDMSTYRLIKPNQFAYCNVTSRNGERITVAHYQEPETAIISQAYDVFEVTDTKKLLPEYLMMWFSRPEFDRYARFMSHGSVREMFSWEDMCEVELPIPHPDKQKEIVKEYNTIANRINLNNQLIQKLEETAQAIYKQWFVDFEFPNEDGKPYKSSGGEMVESELGEVPKGWDVNSFNTLCEITSSKRVFEQDYRSNGIAFYRGKEITLRKSGEPITEPIYISLEKYRDLVAQSGKPASGDILMTAVGTIGSTYLVGADEEFYFKDGNIIWFKSFQKSGLNYLLYDFMQSNKFGEILNEITIGSTQNAITIATLGQQKIITPDRLILKQYAKLSSKLNTSVANYKKQNLLLDSFENLLLSKLATIEN